MCTQIKYLNDLPIVLNAVALNRPHDMIFGPYEYPKQKNQNRSGWYREDPGRIVHTPILQHPASPSLRDLSSLRPDFSPPPPVHPLPTLPLTTPRRDATPLPARFPWSRVLDAPTLFPSYPPHPSPAHRNATAPPVTEMFSKLICCVPLKELLESLQIARRQATVFLSFLLLAKNYRYRRSYFFYLTDNIYHHQPVTLLPRSRVRLKFCVIIGAW